MKRAFSALVLLCASVAFSQTDEWGSPYGSTATPPVEQPKPAETPKPAPPKPVTTDSPRPSSPSQPTDPNAKARAEQRLRAAEGKGPPPADPNAPKLPPDLEALPVVARQEKVVPGTEHHSPATYNLKVTDPGNGRVTVGSVGVGLLHLQSARLGPKGVVRFSILGEYNNLGDFPVLNAQNIRSSGTFAVSWVALSFMEAYLGYTATANTNSRTSPNLIQALGDLTVGLKFAHSFVKSLHTGIDLRLNTFSGVGNQSIDRFAVGFSPGLLVAWDIRELSPKAPLVFHMNIGLTFDTTGRLVSNQTLTASEEYALNVNRYNRVNFGLGLEVPLPFVTPFLEYKLAGPFGVPADGLVGPNQLPVAVTAAMPQRLGVGVKVTAIKDLTLLAGVDIGLSRSVALGIAATAPWNLMLGASFNIDPFQRGETKIVETVRERKVEEEVVKTGRVEGVAIDAQTKQPIAGVMVAVVGQKLPPVASDKENGRFLTYELPAGPAKLKASHDGYKEAERDVTIESKKTQKLQLELEPDVKKATFAITVSGKKKPIAATVTFSGVSDQVAATAADVAAPVKLEAIAGQYSVVANAEGYLAQVRDVQAAPGTEMAVAFDLEPAPKKMLAIIKDGKIEISQQVHFETGKARIMADSNALLNQVIDVMVKNNVKRVRVEGHTDNKGNKEANQKLSQDRADSIVEYLVSRGIDRSRLEAAGFGDTRPVAPNLTARGRELNRRVEFIVLEK